MPRPTNKRSNRKGKAASVRSATSAGAKRGGAVRRRVLLRLASALVLGLVLIALLQVLLLRWIHPVTSAVMVETRIGAWWDGRHDFNLRYQWLDFDDISPYAAVAVVAAEDQKFAEHFGFDVASIESAWEAHEEGRRLRGASTISQQVAKNLFLWPGRSYLRKALEACYTLLLEGLWPKRRILEVYLNIAQFGDGVFGVGAAARLYFHKPALDLTASEAAALAAVLPNPIRFSVRHPSRYVYSRRRWILRQMSNLGGVEWLKDL